MGHCRRSLPLLTVERVVIHEYQPSTNYSKEYVCEKNRDV